MTYSVREKADIVGTYRYVSVFMMETFARWVPTTAEIEAKALFGRHIWDLAQHADRLGQRTAELRAGLHHNRPPTEAAGEVLARLAAVEGTVERIQLSYDALFPYLHARYEEYLSKTDHLLDDPTVRILESMIRDYERMLVQRDEVLRDRPDFAPADSSIAGELRKALDALDLVDFRPAVDLAEAAG